MYKYPLLGASLGAGYSYLFDQPLVPSMLVGTGAGLLKNVYDSRQQANKKEHLTKGLLSDAKTNLLDKSVETFNKIPPEKNKFEKLKQVRDSISSSIPQDILYQKSIMDEFEGNESSPTYQDAKRLVDKFIKQRDSILENKDTEIEKLLSGIRTLQTKREVIGDKLGIIDKLKKQIPTSSSNPLYSALGTGLLGAGIGGYLGQDTLSALAGGAIGASAGAYGLDDSTRRLAQMKSIRERIPGYEF